MLILSSYNHLNQSFELLKDEQMEQFRNKATKKLK